MTDLAWMDGLVFTQLQRSSVDEHGWPETFKQWVRMRACAYKVFKEDRLKTLSILQSNFHFPLLNTCELPIPWRHSVYCESGIIAIQRIHAKVFKFWNFFDRLRLLELLESKDEVEQLDLVLLIGLPSSVALPSAVSTRREF